LKRYGYSLTENTHCLVKACLYFSNLAVPLLIDMGRKKFKKFRITNVNISKEYKKYIPPCGHINGWEDLELEVEKLKQRNCILSKKQGNRKSETKM
jgi:hypothetical protein